MTQVAPPNPNRCQILTPVEPSAIAVVRAAGPAVPAFVQRHVRLRSNMDPAAWEVGQVLRAELLDDEGAAIDDMLVSVHGAPPAWDIRLHLHGSPWLARTCLDSLLRAGFSHDATAGSDIWGAGDALLAEAYELLPEMRTLRGARWLLAQVELLRATLLDIAAMDDWRVARMRCQELLSRDNVVDWFRRPLRVVLVGPPNAGKSTLANALADQSASLVSARPGTTRDWVEIEVECEGFPTVWVDTAGLRRAEEELESAGVERTHRQLRDAEAVVVVLDATTEAADARQRFLGEYAGLTPAAVALTKCDLPTFSPGVREVLPAAWRDRAACVSGVARSGLPELVRATLSATGCRGGAIDLPCPFTVRQREALSRAAAAVTHNSCVKWILRCLGRSGERAEFVREAGHRDTETPRASSR